MVSPPKPWERGSTAAAAAPALSSSVPSSVPEPPPALPASITNTQSQLSSQSQYSSLQANPYSSYSSPYSRFGGMTSSYSPYGSSMYGGQYGSMGMGSYGGYGGMGSYGSYGMGMGMGMPGMMGPNGLPVNPADPSLTQTLEATTHQTFALLHSIVQTFTGVSQMLESTFMATHSSFFAMVGVVDQFGQLRNALGSVLGLFGLVRWVQTLLTGRTPSGSAGLTGEFTEYLNGKPPVPGTLTPPPRPKASKKPLIIFLLAIFGIPYAMTKFIRILNARAQANPLPSQGLLGGPAPAPPAVDPSTLQFARALYAFNPSTPAELGLKENEIVAIMGKLDPARGVEVDPMWEGESEWWRGRTREGREGWFPRKWVEVLERKEKKVE